MIGLVLGLRVVVKGVFEVAAAAVAAAARVVRLRAGLGETDPTDGLARRRDEAATAVLHYVEALARRASVPLETVRLDGEPAACRCSNSPGPGRRT